MKQVFQQYRNGRIEIIEVPAPTLESGMILVANGYSIISTGTERAKVEMGDRSLIGMAMARPDLASKVVDMVRREGIASAARAVRNKLDRPTPLGYSSAGTVLQISPDVRGVAPGDRVACAGGEYAYHAEIIRVPKNLFAPVPPEVDLKESAFATLGAIAMQGVRRLEPVLGETVVVIGLGLIGLLSVQILRAAGIRVLAIDISNERVELAKDLGASGGWPRQSENLEKRILYATQNRGADGILVTASTKQNDPLVLAGHLARERGRVVLVGDVEIQLPREPYYLKEIDFRFSRSYGPGRYDKAYEEKGLSYPPAYVPWTEKRNLECFLDLLAQNQVSIAPLITETIPFEESPSAFQQLKNRDAPPIALALEYQPGVTSPPPTEPLLPAQPISGEIRAALIGAGSFAVKYLIPFLKSDSRIHLQSIAASRGGSSESVARQFGFRSAQTAEEVLSDPSIDLLLIATRHDSHTDLAVKALGRGLRIHLEKPMACTEEDLKRLHQAYSERPGGFLHVGFNRRFAPLIQPMTQFMEEVPGPSILQLRVLAGQLPADHWLLDPDIGGGRLIGEGCHFIDLAHFLIGSRPVRCQASARRIDTESPIEYQDVAISVEYEDGSLANILYLSTGATGPGKERIEYHRGNRSTILDDFRVLECWQEGRLVTRTRSRSDKGHRNQIECLIEATIQGQNSPVPFEESLTTHQTLFEALGSLSGVSHS